MPVVLKARCHILKTDSRIVQSQFDIQPSHEPFGEYVLMNLVRERGLLLDGMIYRITIRPFYPHNVKDESPWTQA
jgi:hypothetical protein